MNTADVQYSLQLLVVLFVLGEFVYSIHTKDGVYSFTSTLGNILSGTVLKFISLQMDVFYSGYMAIIFSLLHYSPSPFSLTSFLYGLLILDFCYYLLHRMKHSVDFFWMFHFVHHSDHKFNMSTYLRASWIERFCMQTIPYFLLVFLGFGPSIIAQIALCSLIYQFFSPSQYIRLPRFLDLIFVTPHNHKIHHDMALKNQKSNFATMFSIWDRLFGTYTADIESFTPGITGYRQDNFLKVQIDPIREYFKKFSLKYL